MDKKSKIFFVVFFLLILGSVGYTYYKIVMKQDYLITMQVDCDPATESCYVYECTPEEDPECPENEEERASYYKILTKKAFNFPECDPNDENCAEPTCQEGEADCEIANCNPEEQPEGEECTKIEDFPAVEEDEEAGESSEEGEKGAKVEENEEESSNKEAEETTSAKDEKAEAKEDEKATETKAENQAEEEEKDPAVPAINDANAN